MQKLNVPRFPDCRSKLSADDLFFFALPESGHQEDPSAQPSLAKRNTLIGRRNPEPLGAFRLECQRTRSRTMPVSVGLDDGACNHFRANVRLHGTKILSQR